MSRREQSVPFNAEPRPEHVIENGCRLDGRGFEEFRRVFLKTGVISQASGSAYAELGKTKIMVGVYGPRQIERRTTYSEEGRINCDVKYTTFATRQRRKIGQSPEEREMSATMQTALEAALQLDSFPKAQLDVFCTILEAGGSELAAAITAASLAIADAGVEMIDLVTACEVSKVESGLLLDPSADEAYREDAGILMCMMTTNNEVAQLMVRGRLADVELREGLELAMGGCSQLDGAVRQCLIEAALGGSA